MDFPEMADITIPDQYTAPNLRTAYCAGVLNWPEPEAVSSHRYTEQEAARGTTAKQHGQSSKTGREPVKRETASP